MHHSFRLSCRLRRTWLWRDFRGKLKYQAAELAVGAVFAGALRFVCHFITGWTIWSVWAPEGMPAWLYSLGYNATYMVPEIIITAIGAALISLILDFQSPDITRRRAKETAATPRNNSAVVTKLTGIPHHLRRGFYAAHPLSYFARFL